MFPFLFNIFWSQKDKQIIFFNNGRDWMTTELIKSVLWLSRDYIKLMKWNNDRWYISFF